MTDIIRTKKLLAGITSDSETARKNLGRLLQELELLETRAADRPKQRLREAIDTLRTAGIVAGNLAADLGTIAQIEDPEVTAYEQPRKGTLSGRDYIRCRVNVIAERTDMGRDELLITTRDEPDPHWIGARNIELD